MTSSKKTSLQTQILDSDDRIPIGVLAYFQQRLKNRFHEEMVNQFFIAQDNRGLTKAELARKLGKKPEQITRWLSVPGNLRLETISDLMLAIGGLEPVVEMQSAIEKPQSNVKHRLATVWEQSESNITFKANSAWVPATIQAGAVNNLVEDEAR